MALPALLMIGAENPAARTPAPQMPPPAVTQQAGGVRPGIEVFLSNVPARFRGKRVGLITNSSAIDRSKTLDIDLIARHQDLKLVALLAPEHGIRGDAPAGATIVDEVDPRTGVPVYSLYGAGDRGPTPEMLKDVDVLVYDLQEVGGRTWTYVSTMAVAMQAAAKKNIPFVVLDRPNPIGGEIVEGALLDPAFASFVGMYPIPARHGMTVGELATLFNRRYGIGADLTVVRVENWRRSQWLDETGLPWVNPSPNLRSLAAVTSYPGAVYFEGTNVAEGRGTDRPFEQIGAAWLNAAEVARVMNNMRLPGIRFEAITMAVEATAGKFPGQTIPAIRFAITDRQSYRPVRTMLLLIDAIHRQHPREFTWRPSIDRLTGSDKVRMAIDAGRLQPLLDEWDREAASFVESRKPFLLYLITGKRSRGRHHGPGRHAAWRGVTASETEPSTRRASRVDGSVLIGGRSRPRDGIRILLEEVVDLALGSFALISVALLQLADDLVELTRHLGQVVVSQLAPAFLDFSLNLLPLTLQGISVHRSSPCVAPRRAWLVWLLLETGMFDRVTSSTRKGGTVFHRCKI